MHNQLSCEVPLGDAACQHTALVHIHSSVLQDRASQIFAMLLNKLATNALPDEWRPEGRKLKACVRLSPDGPPLRTPEALLQAMIDEGAEIDMRVVSRITGFGLGACCARPSLVQHQLRCHHSDQRVQHGCNTCTATDRKLRPETVRHCHAKARMREQTCCFSVQALRWRSQRGGRRYPL